MFFHGIEVVKSLYVPLTHLVPVKEHKGLCKTQYSKRVQKKWNNRYGMKRTPYVIQQGNKLIMHPETYKVLKDY